MLPLRDEISRVREDLEKERNRTIGAKMEAVELNNWFHVLEDYVRNQPIANPDHTLDNRESETARRNGAIW